MGGQAEFLQPLRWSSLHSSVAARGQRPGHAEQHQEGKGMPGAGPQTAGQDQIRNPSSRVQGP